MDDPSNPPSSPGRRRVIEFSSSPPRERSEVSRPPGDDNLPAFEDETEHLARDQELEDEEAEVEKTSNCKTFNCNPEK